MKIAWVSQPRENGHREIFATAESTEGGFTYEGPRNLDWIVEQFKRRMKDPTPDEVLDAVVNSPDYKGRIVRVDLAPGDVQEALRIDAIAEILEACYRGGALSPLLTTRVLLESVEESDDDDLVALHVMEAFTGYVTTKTGKKMYFLNGKPAKAPGSEGAPAQKGKAAKETPAPKAAAAPAPDKAAAKAQNVAKANELIAAALKGQKSPEQAKELAAHLGKLSVADLNAIKKKHGIKGGKLKAEVVAKIAAHVGGGAAPAKAKAPAKKAASDNTPAFNLPDDEFNQFLADTFPKAAPRIAKQQAEKMSPEGEDFAKGLSEELKKSRPKPKTADSEAKKGLISALAAYLGKAFSSK
jgi:hypothetical protein